MSPDHTDFTLLKAALDLTSSLDLKAGLQNFVNQACALTSSPHSPCSTPGVQQPCSSSTTISARYPRFPTH